MRRSDKNSIVYAGTKVKVTGFHYPKETEAGPNAHIWCTVEKLGEDGGSTDKPMVIVLPVVLTTDSRYVIVRHLRGPPTKRVDSTTSVLNTSRMVGGCSLERVTASSGSGTRRRWT